MSTDSASGGMQEVDYASLRVGASDVKQAREDTNTNLIKLRDVADDLVMSWQGAASGGFTNVMRRWDDDVKKLLGALDGIAELLTHTANVQQVNEEQQQQTMNKYVNRI